MDPEVNRKALGKALEKYRDQPTAALGQFDLASESLLVSFLVCSSAWDAHGETVKSYSSVSGRHPFPVHVFRHDIVRLIEKFAILYGITSISQTLYSSH